MKNHLLAIIAVLGAALAACAVPQHDSASSDLSRPAPNPVWRVPTQLELTLKYGAEFSAWRSSYFPDGTILMASLAPAATGGEILLVGGHALAVRGVAPSRRDILETVDDVMLNQQLATLLLQQAFPRGPQMVTATQRVQVDESDTPVGAETTNTSRYFYPPWKLRGEVRRTTADSVAFDLQFEAQLTGATVAATRTTKLSLSGIWQQQTPAPRLADDFSLVGWSVYRIRMGTRDVGGVTTAAYVTTADSRRYPTLGELRAALPNSGKQ